MIGYAFAVEGMIEEKREGYEHTKQSVGNTTYRKPSFTHFQCVYYYLTFFLEQGHCFLDDRRSKT